MKIQHTNDIHSSARCMRKNKKSRILRATFTLLPLTLAVAQALANPDGGVVVGGQASISQVPGLTIVDQASNRAIINWNGFSIDPGELTKFNQPGKGAIALNRVIGNDPSQLLGQLQANGHVWLVNPNGILFGPSARVDVHGLLATTADIVDQDFLAGRNHFSIPSPNAGATVVNQGSISIGEHGLAALVAPHVRNAGIIQGKMGQVVIAGTPTFTLDFYGDGLIQFEATSKVTENANPAGPLVRNDGTISVDGGNVLITANAAAGIVDEAINMDGIIEARSVGMENGVIVLKGGDEGLVRVAGSLDASGRDTGETGGTVKVLGEKVALYAGTRIDASGDAGGGEVLIGGNFQGKGAEPNAKRTYVASGASIDADAVTRGNGGKVIVWADEVTGFAGDISATSGINDGDGGFVEVSGKQDLTFEGSVDVSANNGRSGTLLLDPENIDIIFDGGEGAADDIELIDNEILFGDPGVTFTISETALEGLAADANIILEATNNITIEQLLDDNTLNFQATTGSITFRAVGTFTSQGTDIETQGGNVTIEAGLVAGSSMEIRTNGGDISFLSRNGAIPVGLSLFTNASSALASGGNITIEAQGDIFLRGRPLNIDTSGPLGGGNVAITSNGGTVDIGNLNASSNTSNGGEVVINASGSIFTGAIVSSGVSAGGNVNLTAVAGAIATDFATEGPPLKPIDTSSKAGTGGSVDLTALTRISVGAINTSGALASGDITLESDQLDLTEGIDSVRGPGADLLIQPASPDQTIIIAGVGEVSLDLTPAELAALADGFNTITIGRADGAGTLTVDPAGASFSSPLILQSPDPGGTIIVNGLLQTNANPLSLVAGNIIDINANITTIDGAININSNGTVDTTGGDLNSNGGIVTIAARSDIFLGNIFTGFVLTPAGDIVVTSSEGAIDTTTGKLSASTDAGNAGAVRLEAATNITTGEIIASSLSGNGGDITLISSGGTIDTSLGQLNSISVVGDAGAISADASGNITTGDIFASAFNLNDDLSGTGSSGGINLNSLNGDITTGGLLSPSEASFGPAGSSGDIIVTAANGSITVDGLIWAFSNAAVAGGSGNAGNGGAITLSAAGDITVLGVVEGSPFSIQSKSRSDAGIAGDGSSVTITSSAGNILINGDIKSSSIGSNASGSAGDVVLTAPGTITIDNIDASAGDLATTAASGSGGAVALTSSGGDGGINAGDITSAASGGAGGAITLISGVNIAAGSIIFGSISGMISAPLTADAPGTIQLAGLAANAADINIGTLTRPGNLLLPNAIDTSGGNVTLFVGNAYTFATDLITDQGNFSLDGLQALTLNSSIDTNGGDVTVQTGSGALTVNGPVSAGDAVSDSAIIELTAGSDLILNNDVTAQSIVLRAGNAITQSAETSINATNLGIAAVAAPTLNLGTSDVVTLAAQITGAGNPFSFTDNNGLVVGQVGSLTGISTNNGDVTVQTGSGDLIIDRPISAGDAVSGSATIELTVGTDLILNNDVAAQSIVLRAGNAITQSVGASISTTNLGVAAVAAPTLNVGTSDVVTLAAQITGADNPFSFTDNNGLIVGQVGSLNGISTNNGDVTVQTGSGALIIDGPISAGDAVSGSATIELTAGSDLILNNDVTAQSIVLIAGNVITQSAETSINATNLGIAAVAAPTLNVGTGDVVTLAAQITGADNPFSFTDNNGLIIGQVGSLTGISTNNGDVTLDVAGDLTVDETINTGGNIVLQATENMVINASFDLATQAADKRVVLQAGDDITVNAAITTQGADLHIEANSPHQGFGANGIVGGITSNAPLATNGGDITLIGTGAINMNAVFDAGDGTISHSSPGPFSIVVSDNANFFTNARTTGTIVLGRAQSAGDDGLGSASETYTASDITFNNMNLDPAVASKISVIATNNVTFEGSFTTGQALFVNADADADGSGAISTTVNGVITPGGPLQLTAGSGIDIDTTNLGSVAAFTSGGNIVVENTGGSSTVTTVSNVSGLTAADGTITFITDGRLTVEQAIKATASNIEQTSILLSVKDGFINEFTDVLGQTALQPGGGRYLVYSVDPEQDTRGITVDQFSKRYSFPFDPDDPDGDNLGLASDDNFFLYEISPILTLVADDASRGMAESDPDFTYTFSGLIDGDTLDSALDELLILTTTADLTSLPGDYPIEIGPMDLASTLGYTIERIDGNLTVDEGELGTIQSINILLPPIPLDKQLIPVVPLVLTDQPGTTFTIPDLPTFTESSNLLSPNDGNRELWGTSK